MSLPGKVDHRRKLKALDVHLSAGVSGHAERGRQFPFIPAFAGDFEENGGVRSL